MAVMSARAFFSLASYTSAAISESSKQNPVMSSVCLLTNLKNFGGVYNQILNFKLRIGSFEMIT